MQEYQVKVYKGITEWYQNGKRHRLDGPAIEWAGGGKSWYQNGKRHRLDGPAIELSDGSKEWFLNGQRHRLDGPAIEWADGAKSWWINDQLLTKGEFNQKMNPVELTMEDIAKLAGVPVSQLKIKK